MKHIVYVSTSINLMTEEELIEILEVARERNIGHNITGVLLYSNGTFIQLLEGLTDDVNFIYKSIERDFRHKNIIKLIDKPASSRVFPDWSMGFSLIDSARAEELLGFLTTTDKILNSEKTHVVVTMLKKFIAANNLNINY